MDHTRLERHQQHGATGAEACPPCVAVVVPLALVRRRQWVGCLLLTSLAPGLEPRLLAAQDVRIGIVNRLFQLGNGRHLVRQTFVILAKIKQLNASHLLSRVIGCASHRQGRGCRLFAARR